MKWLRRIVILGQLKVAQARAAELRDYKDRLPGMILRADEAVRILRCRLYDAEHAQISKLRPHPSPVTDWDRARAFSLQPQFLKYEPPVRVTRIERKRTPRRAIALRIAR